MPDPQLCFVIRINHFDPIWRRCWDRDFVDAGRRFVSYRAIEEAWMDDAIRSCADGKGCFVIEATWVVRHYLQRHPEHISTLRKLVEQERFDLLGAGENIVDANLIHGELLARNLILGTLWAQETLGERPQTGWHFDGFGSCAQMPQIFRQCGYRWLASLSYNTPDAPYWRGLDGSTIFFCADAGCGSAGRGRVSCHNGAGGEIGRKHPPCPHCQGQGCPACAQRGFRESCRSEFVTLPTERLPGEVGVFFLGGEESLPGLHVAEDIARFNAAHPEFDIRQGTYRDLAKFIAEDLSRVDDPPAEQISSKVENNPWSSGCYVTRIAMKQRHRAAEHALLAAERWDAILNAGRSAAELRECWRNMTLSGFHDAVTSSHVDAAFAELMDLLADIRRATAGIADRAMATILRPSPRTFTIFNPHSHVATAAVKAPVPQDWAGASVVADGVELPCCELEQTPEGKVVTFVARDWPAISARSVTIASAPARVAQVCDRTLRLGRFALEAGDHGITAVAVDDIGAVTDTCRLLFGELILEHDFGDPWATRSLDRTRERLSPYVRLQSIERHGESVAITYAGRHPSSNDVHGCQETFVTYLTWQQVFRVREGLPWIDIETTVDWYTHSRRLRLAFPSTTALDHGVYEVPYGILERDRYEPTTNHGGNGGGDWPAIHWAGIQAPAHTFAIFNAGTPSYRIEDGVVTNSILRSPQIPYSLLEPESYVAENYHGMEDHGRHQFRHALYVAPGHWRDNDTARQAAVFNGGMQVHAGGLAAPAPSWRLDAAHTQLAVLKSAEDANGVIVRLVEQAGRQEIVRLLPPPEFTHGQITNLLEEPQESLSRTHSGFAIPIKPWQILTVRVTR